MTRILWVALAVLLSSCGFGGGNCDDESTIEKASQLESRMKCDTSNNLLASHIEGADSFEVLEFPDLVSIKGGLRIQGFPNVREIRFPKLTEINSPNGDGLLDISNMPSLELVQLPALRKVTNHDTTPAGVSFFENPRLKTINLDSLATSSDLGFGLLESLQQLSLPALNGLITLRVIDNLRLESIELAGIGGSVLALSLSDNPTLGRISGTGQVELTELTLSALPFFTDFDLAVTSVATFVQVEQTGLVAFALDDLTTVETVEMQDNAALESISMASATTISNRLFLQDNEALSSISFPAAEMIGKMEIVENPMLPECQVQDLAAQVLERSGENPNLISRFNLADECAN